MLIFAADEGRVRLGLQQPLQHPVFPRRILCRHGSCQCGLRFVLARPVLKSADTLNQLTGTALSHYEVGPARAR